MRSTLLVALLALALGPATSPAQAATAKPCAHHKGAHTLRHSARVVVYRTAGSKLGARIYACWRPTGRTLLLHTNTGGAAVTDVIFDQAAVSGRVVAFLVQASGDRNYEFARSVDVRSGRRLRSSGIVERPSGVLPFPLPPSAIATNARGAIIWLASGVLRVADADSIRTVATTGPGPITDVAASSATASWTQGGARHENPLR